jgi:drug/metabolite transporter (DMT)-like permease
VTPRLALLMSVPPLLWAGNAVVGRLVVGEIPPLELNALRWILAVAILAPLGWRAIAAPASRRAIAARWKAFALLGLIGIGCYNAFQYAALATSTPINVTLIAASSPVFMLALGAAFHGVHPAPRDIAGAVLSIAGVLVVLSRGELAHLAAVRFVPGDLLMIAAVLCWSVYTWMLARPPRSLAGGDWPKWTWSEFLLVQTTFGAAWASAAALVETAVAPHAITRWSLWLVAAIAYVAIGPAVIAYRCWALGVASAGPASAAFFSNLTPLFAALMSAALLGDPPRVYHALAFALIVGGIVVSARARQRRAS